MQSFSSCLKKIILRIRQNYNANHKRMSRSRRNFWNGECRRIEINLHSKLDKLFPRMNLTKFKFNGFSLNDSVAADACFSRSKYNLKLRKQFYKRTNTILNSLINSHRNLYSISTLILYLLKVVCYFETKRVSARRR